MINYDELEAKTTAATKGKHTKTQAERAKEFVKLENEYFRQDREPQYPLTPALIQYDRMFDEYEAAGEINGCSIDNQDADEFPLDYIDKNGNLVMYRRR